MIVLHRFSPKRNEIHRKMIRKFKYIFFWVAVSRRVTPLNNVSLILLQTSSRDKEREKRDRDRGNDDHRDKEKEKDKEDTKETIKTEVKEEK